MNGSTRLGPKETLLIVVYAVACTFAIVAQLDSRAVRIRNEEVVNERHHEELLVKRKRENDDAILELQVQRHRIQRLGRTIDRPTEEPAYVRDGRPPEDGNIGSWHVEPRIDGVITDIKDRSDLRIVSIGSRVNFRSEMQLTVHDVANYITRIEIDHIQSDWSACHELEFYQKSPPQVGNIVSTRAFD